MIEINPSKDFVVAKAIRTDNAEMFAGRKSSFDHVFEHLSTEGTSVAVIGEKGIGKTSFGWQVMDILSGNPYLVDRLGLESSMPSNSFCCVWVQCKKRYVDIYGVLAALLRPPTATGYASKFSFYWWFPEILEEETIHKKILETLVRKSNERYEDIDHLFGEVIDAVNIMHPDKDVLVFMDEFDRLPSKQDVGELLKAASARFVFIGVADDVSDIIADHGSVERKLRPLKLTGLSSEEIDQIFDRVEGKYKGHLSFSREFRLLAVEYSDRFPYLVQYIGQESLQACIKRMHDHKSSPSNPYVVTTDDFRLGFQKIASPAGMSERYNKLDRAIEASIQRRRKILFTLSLFDEDWVQQNAIIRQSPETQRDFYANIRELEQFGIIKRRERSLRFTDPLTRAIVKYLGSYEWFD